MTLHRPHNVDNIDNLKIILDAFANLSQKYKIVFPVHPRKSKLIHQLLKDEYNSPKNIILLEPLGYLEFLNLNINCAVVVTDSGGLQEETTVLKKPCITIRPNTERAITCTHGTNYLLTILDKKEIIRRVDMVFSGEHNPFIVDGIKYWDGKTGGRIAEIIDKEILKN